MDGLTAAKERYGVRQLMECGEKLSADVSSTGKFKQDFKKHIEDSGYTWDQIYNCDESGLNDKLLPSKTLASQQEKCAPGYKRSQERLAVMAGEFLCIWQAHVLTDGNWIV
ncbi:hypothetical protein Trydic_g21509 [Trypoxylus dichotomus]